MTQIEKGNSLDLISLVVRYAEEQTSYNLTGFGNGDEILQTLKQQILLLVLEYPKTDLASFLIVLAE